MDAKGPLRHNVNHGVTKRYVENASDDQMIVRAVPGSNHMEWRVRALSVTIVGLVFTSVGLGHGTVVEPVSRVYRVYLSNPESPGFPLALEAVEIDGTDSYYTWNELSRNIPEAVQAGLPPGFDYSPWVPDGQLASAGRVDPDSTEYPRTYAGLDQVSPDWPMTAVTAGATITVDFYATAQHEPSVWDVWMTTPDWDASSPLTWAQMEFLRRPTVTLRNSHYLLELEIPPDRSGHHVLWIAWQRDDPAGEVFFSTSDIDVAPIPCPGDLDASGDVGVLDLIAIIKAWGPCGGCPEDVDEDGLVDVTDLVTVITSWGPCS